MDSSNSRIYNYYFNSTNNVYDRGSTIWNVTGVSGINIISGNYWSKDADAVLILQMAACGINIDPAADVNSDGAITSLDALMVSQAVMKGMNDE